MNTKNKQDGIEKSDRYLKTVKFLEARSKEIDYFQYSLQNKKITDMKSVQQNLPKHMRRRSMSHNRNRIPSKVRKIAKHGFTDNHKKTQKYNSRKTARKRLLKSKTNLYYLWKYNYLTKEKILETHQYLSRRNHMKSYYNFKIPNKSQQKRFRTTYKFSHNFQVICDKSYFTVITLESNLVLLTEAQQWQNIFKNYFYFIEGQDSTLFILDPSLCDEIIKRIEKFQEKNKIKISYKIRQQFLNIFEVIGNKCLKGLYNFLKNYREEGDNSFDFFKGYFSGLQLPQNFQIVQDVKYKKRDQYKNQIIEEQNDYQEQVQKLYEFYQQYKPNLKNTDKFIQSLQEIESKRLELENNIQLNVMSQEKDKSILFESIFNNKNEQLTLENQFKDTNINFLIKNFSIKQDHINKELSRFLILTPPSTGNFFLKNLVNSNMLLIAQEEYEFLLHNLNMPVFPRDYINTKEGQLTLNKTIQMNIDQFLKKQRQYRFDYFSNNFQFPFGMQIDIDVNINIQIIFIQMIGKGTIQQNALIYALKENDFEKIDTKNVQKNSNKVMQQILNYEYNTFQLKEEENQASNLAEFKDINQYLDELQNLQSKREVIGSITSGNFNYGVQKSTGYGFILTQKLNEEQQNIKLPQYAWIRNPKSLNYYAVKIKKI